MKSYIALVAAGLVATTAATAAPGVNPEHKFLDFVPLEKRQNVSPEKYACHENCGTSTTHAPARDIPDLTLNPQAPSSSMAGRRAMSSARTRSSLRCSTSA